MSGWRRAFVLLAGITLAACAGLAWLDKPSADGPDQAYACFDLGFTQATPSEAMNTLRSSGQHGKMSSDCRERLHVIADGSSQRERMRWWWGEVRQIVSIALGFLIVIYLLAVSIGWVWRGFVPRKT